MLPLPVLTVCTFARKTSNCSFRIVRANMIHKSIEHTRRIIFNYCHNAVKKSVCTAVFDKTQNSIGKRIIHNRIKLISEQISPSFAVSEFICGILPHFTDNKSVFIFSLNGNSQIIKENIGQFICNIKAPAAYTAAQPSAQNTVFAADIISVIFVFFNNFRQQFNAPPTLIFIGIIYKFIPTEILAVTAVICTYTVIPAIHIEVF